MIRSILRRAVLAAALLAPTLATHTAHATVVVPLTQDQLAQRADLIVRATVVSQRVTWNQTHTQIVTLTDLAVQEYMKGSGASTLTLRQFGGTIDGRTEMVEGDGHLAVGEEAILFLRTGDGVVFLTALAQSVFHVERQGTTTTVRRDLSNLTFAIRTADGRFVYGAPPNEIPVSLDRFSAIVRQLVGGAR